MNEDTENLKAADELDSELSVIRLEIARLQQIDKKIRTAVAAEKKKLADLAQKIAQAEAARRKFESDLKHAEHKARSSRERLSQARTPKEAEALEHEAAGAEAEAARLEEATFSALETEENLKAENDRATSAYEQWIPQQKETIKRTQLMMEEKQSLANDLEQERIAAINRMTTDLRDTYEWLVKEYGAGRAISRLDGSSCSRCGNVLVPGLIDKVRHGEEQQRCPNCSRYLML